MDSRSEVESGGKYVSFGFSVRLNGCGEMTRLDEQIKLVTGLTMVL